MSSPPPASAGTPVYSILQRLGFDDDDNGSFLQRPTSPTPTRDSTSVIRAAIYDMPEMVTLRQHLHQADDLADAYITLGTTQLSQATTDLSRARISLTTQLGKLRASDDHIVAETQCLIEQTSRRLGAYGVRDEAGNRIPLDQTISDTKALVARAEIRFEELLQASAAEEAEIGRIMEMLETDANDDVREGIKEDVVTLLVELQLEGRALAAKAEDEVEKFELAFQQKQDDYLQKRITKLESMRNRR